MHDIYVAMQRKEDKKVLHSCFCNQKYIVFRFGKLKSIEMYKWRTIYKSFQIHRVQVTYMYWSQKGRTTKYYLKKMLLKYDDLKLPRWKGILWPFKKLEILCYMENHRTNIILHVESFIIYIRLFNNKWKSRKVLINTSEIIALRKVFDKDMQIQHIPEV